MKKILVNRLKQYFIPLIVIGLVAIIGVILLISSRAASPYGTVLASSGTVAGGAVSQNCAGSVGGKCVTFPAKSTSVRLTVVGHQLSLGPTGPRLKMHGAAVWGMQDQTTTSFGTNEYNARTTVISTLKSWGSNVVRLRALGCDYNSQLLSKTEYINEIKAWQKLAQDNGMYTGITWWDPSDCGSSISHANWASNYSEAFQMMKDVVNALGANNDWVFYEPFNEPNNISESSWLTAMKATEANFRSVGYTGILVLDMDGYSHIYNDADMKTLEDNDAAQPGMNGKHQIIFAKHDYANEYPNPDSTSFSATDWANNTYGNGSWEFSKHLVWETEFGNYNGSSSSVHPNWSAAAATFMADKVNDGTLVGGTGFLFGPWWDANAMTGGGNNGDNTNPSTWGNQFKNNFLNRVQ